MKNISVIIITLNEEENIEDCIKSVNWVDEIIVVDSSSVDKTVEIAKSLNAKVYQTEWKGYSAAKNFALNHAKSEWVLSLDADERVTPEMKNEIISILKTGENKYAGYEVSRKTIFLGKWIRHCGWYPGYTLRFFKNKMGKFTDSLVHESIQINGEKGRLKNGLIHYTNKDIFHYFEKYNKYTSLAAQDMLKHNKSFRIIDLIFRPVFTFTKMYFLRNGWMDGIHGLLLSVFSASYVFTKYAKLWELNKKMKG